MVRVSSTPWAQTNVREASCHLADGEGLQCPESLSRLRAKERQ